jgi:hypothetical protein
VNITNNNFLHFNGSIFIYSKRFTRNSLVINWLDIKTDTPVNLEVNSKTLEENESKNFAGFGTNYLMTC